LKEVLDELSDFTPAATEQAVKMWITQNGYHTGTIMNALRLVLVGASRGPHIFNIISWLGKEETLNRIDRGLTVIGNHAQ
jgi:glutamyl-tRNA synthetase